MLNEIRKALRLAPQRTPSGAYSPSPLSLKLATVEVTDYEPIQHAGGKPAAGRKALVICTETAEVPMTNGTRFSSGNHPVETFVPLLHLYDAGYEADIVTPTGKPVALEMWAMPAKDENVQGMYERLRPQLEHPGSLSDLAAADFVGAGPYDAVFVPGGHGALMVLPDDEFVGDALRHVHSLGGYVISICHGPAALLTTARPGEGSLFEGYEIAAFPDAVDRQMPLLGYMPGQLTWFFNAELKKIGITVTNVLADKTVHADRRLLTGASPLAANQLGVLAARTLVDALALRS